MKVRKSAVFGAIAAVVLGLVGPATFSSAGPVSDASGFESDDGNLAVDSTFDWNGFAPLDWTGDAPYREAEKTASGWSFKGFEDDSASNTDTAFSGGVKQDDDCATLKPGKAPNKDDLERAYLSTDTVGGDVS